MNMYYAGMEFELPSEAELCSESGRGSGMSTNNHGDQRMSITKIEDIKSFQDIISKEEDVLVKFEAEWCAPCKAMSPVVEEVARQNPGLRVVAIDIEEAEGFDDILREYSVRCLPTFVRVRSGNRVGSTSGTVSKAELSSFVQAK